MTAALARLWRTGDPFVWLTAGALATALMMIVGLLALILSQALGVFWPRAVAQIEIVGGGVVVGSIRAEESLPDAEGRIGGERRILVQVGNRDFWGADFRWLPSSSVLGVRYPRDLVTLEREEWGNFYGWVDGLRIGETTVATGPEATWQAMMARLPAARALAARIQEIERKQLGDINQSIEEARLRLRRLEYRAAPPQASARPCWLVSPSYKRNTMGCTANSRHCVPK
ncbi:MAG: hypothetical protein KatS3mg077_2151 [Candidatus Binatia bacterium]|nr:MAG: hypothetical protein KatS3mg077_2151 [Candidatus Binatia bacterium]